MGWECRCIRRRLIIICTKYFVIVNYGSATAFRGRDQASSRGTRARGWGEARMGALLHSAITKWSRDTRFGSRRGILLRSFRPITAEQTLIRHFSFSCRRILRYISHEQSLPREHACVRYPGDISHVRSGVSTDRKNVVSRFIRFIRDQIFVLNSRNDPSSARSPFVFRASGKCTRRPRVSRITVIPEREII